MIGLHKQLLTQLMFKEMVSWHLTTFFNFAEKVDITPQTTK